MRDTLYLRLTGNDDAVEACLSPAKGLRQRSQRLPLAQALNNAGGCRLVLLVPGSEVRLTTVSVPAKQPQKILQAAPYALEDQFAEDVDTLHFAIGPTAADGRTPVAVVARATMERWLAPLRERKLKPELVLPEYFGLPPPAANRWQVLVEPQQSLVRNAAYGGFVCAPTDLAVHVQLAGGEQTTLSVQTTQGASTDLSALGERADVRSGPALGLDALAAQLDENGAINLLQGSYGLGQDLQLAWKPWRLAAALAAAWLLVSLTSQALSVRANSRALEQQEARNLQRFQALFPNETRIVDLSAQAEQQLRALSSGGGQSSLFNLLEVVRAGLAAESSLSLQSLQLRDGALFVSLSGSDLQALDRLRAWYATRREVRMEVQTANSSSLGVQIRLKLTPA